MFLGGPAGTEALVDLLGRHLSRTGPAGGPGDPGVFRTVRAVQRAVPGDPVSRAVGVLRIRGCCRADHGGGRLARDCLRAVVRRPPAQPAGQTPAARPAPALALAGGVRAGDGAARRGGREIRRVLTRMRRVVAVGRDGRRVRHDGISLRGNRGQHARASEGVPAPAGVKAPDPAIGRANRRAFRAVTGPAGQSGEFTAIKRIKPLTQQLFTEGDRSRIESHNRP